MKTFNDLEFIETIGESRYGIHARMAFDNGWEVSVVKGEFTHGGDRGLYELAVFKDGEIHYDNWVAIGDVAGCLRPEDVTDAMGLVQGFPKEEEEPKGDVNFMHKWIKSKSGK